MPSHRLSPGVPTWASVVLVALTLLTWQGWSLASQRPGGLDETGLWISESRTNDGHLLLLVVDQSTRHAAVYHLDGASGTITLKSTRDLSYDLKVGDFNAQEPRPAALRKMLQTPGVGELPP